MDGLGPGSITGFTCAELSHIDDVEDIGYPKLIIHSD